MRVCCSEVKGHKGQPDDAGGVHGETNVLCLIEVLRNFSCFDGVNCANSDQDHAVHLDTDELLNIKCSSSIVKKRVASPQFYATCTHLIKENFGTRKIFSGPPGYYFLVSILTRNILHTISWKVLPSDTNQDTFVENTVKTLVFGPF